MLKVFGVIIAIVLFCLPNAGDAQDIPIQIKVGCYGIGAILLFFSIVLPCIRTRKRQKAYEHQQQERYARLNSATMLEVDRMSGREFEDFCVVVLAKNGFVNIRKTKASGDQGVDIIAESKTGEKLAVQCKRYKNHVGNKPVQEVYAGAKFYGCNMAVVMTNSWFTHGAIELAKRTGVILIDRNELSILHKKA